MLDQPSFPTRVLRAVPTLRTAPHVLVLFLVLLLLPGVSPTLAQNGVWVPEGPAGGPVSAVAIGPQDSELLYAGTRGSGIFRSTDGGGHWVELPASPFDGPVNALALDPARPARVFAALEGSEEIGGVYRTTNGGATWTRTVAGVFRDLAFDPVDPDTVWAGSVSGLFRSDDGGVTWERVPSMGGGGPALALAIAVDPSDPAILYAGGDGEVLRSDDGGATWSTLTLPPSAGLVKVLAVSPDDSTRVYAGTEGGLFRSADGGVTWTELGPGFYSIQDLVLDPDNPQEIHLVSQTVISDPPAPSGVFRSTDGGEQWASTVHGLTGETLALALDPQNPERLLAGTSEGAFLRSETGKDWVRSNNGLFAHPIRDLDVPRSAPGLIFAVDAFGEVFRSADDGQGWARILGGVSSLTPHPDDPTRVYGFSPGPQPLVVSRDSGLTFAPGDFAVHPGFRQSVVFHDLAVDPADPDTLYVGDVLSTFAGFQVSTFENVHRSTDGGESWDSGWLRPTLAARDLAVDPFDPDIVYAATQQGLRVSRNAGAAWGPPASVPGPLASRRVVPDPAQEGRLWLAGETTLARSDDRGLTAVRVDAQLPAGRILDLATDPTADVVYVLIEDRGVFRSADAGASWTSLTGNLFPHRITGPLAVSVPESQTGSPGGPRTVRVGTVTGVRALAGPPACTPGPGTLCLLGARFQVTVAWQDFQGGSGPGHTRTVTDDTGAFWFFDPSNLELMVKAIDGRSVNGSFWIFYGSLSNVGFELTVTDTATGATRVFTNPMNRFASAGITDAFPAEGDGSTFDPSQLASAAESRVPAAAGLLACGTATNLCLQAKRFRVEVIWRDFQGGTGQGKSVPLTSDTGAFWFFDPDNLELMVKVLDGRPVNGHFWVFLGSLSNVNFEVLVTDTATGRSWTRENPAGTFASVGDALAFSDLPVPGAAP